MPQVPAEFWRSEQLRAAFAAQHIGRVSRAYRVHPYHEAVYGRRGIPQTLLGQWMNRTQAQISRIENGPPVRNLDSLMVWVRTLKLPAEVLWFRLPPADPDAILAAAEPDPDPEADPVVTVEWTQRGTVEAVVALSGGARVKRRVFLTLTGPVLTAPAHQWLVHDPEPVISGLSGRRIGAAVADRIRTLAHQLIPHVGVPAVRDFLDRARTLTTAQA